MDVDEANGGDGQRDFRFNAVLTRRSWRPAAPGWASGCTTTSSRRTMPHEKWEADGIVDRDVWRKAGAAGVRREQWPIRPARLAQRRPTRTHGRRRERRPIRPARLAQWPPPRTHGRRREPWPIGPAGLAHGGRERSGRELPGRRVRVLGRDGHRG
jgi:hypothetical protein